jgi:cell division protein FtsZ
VLVHVAGGTELTLNEVTVLMEEFNRHISETTRVSFGVAADAKLGRKIVVSILCGTAPVTEAAPIAKVPQSVPVAPLPERAAAPTPVPVPVVDEFFPEPQIQELAIEPTPAFSAPAKAASPAMVAAPATVTPAAKKYAPAAAVAATAAKSGASARKEERAEQMTLEPANRGRFEKSEPTIVDGEDLDVPTFLRKTARR